MTRPDYRDEIAAAHARIAELEDKVSALETELERPGGNGVVADDVAEFEAEVALRRKAARPEPHAYRWAAPGVAIMVVAAIAVAGLAYAGGPHEREWWLTTGAAVAALLLTCFGIWRIERRGARLSATRALRDAERRLAAVRVAASVGGEAPPTEWRVALHEQAENETASELEAVATARARR